MDVNKTLCEIEYKVTGKDSEQTFRSLQEQIENIVGSKVVGQAHRKSPEGCFFENLERDHYGAFCFVATENELAELDKVLFLLNVKHKDVTVKRLFNV